MHCTEYVVSMQKKNFQYNHRSLSGMHSEITKQMLPFLDSAAFIIRKAAQIRQMSFKADSRNVWHADKFYTAGVIRVFFFFGGGGVRQSTGPITGIRKPTPLDISSKISVVIKVLLLYYQINLRDLCFGRANYGAHV